MGMNSKRFKQRRSKIHSSFKRDDRNLKLAKRREGPFSSPSRSGESEEEGEGEEQDEEKRIGNNNEPGEVHNAFARAQVDGQLLDEPAFEDLLSRPVSSSESVSLPHRSESKSDIEGLEDLPHNLKLVEQDLNENELQKMRNEEPDTTLDASRILELEDDDNSYYQLGGPRKRLHGPTELESSERKQAEHIISVGRRYVHQYKLPPVLFAEQLVTKARKHLPLVEDILCGKHTSLYYDHARKAYKKSQKAVLSVDEFRNLDLREFTAGFYGAKRQMRVALEVLHCYKDLITKQKNSVLRWWGTNDFAQYVLAPELLSALCREEMALSSIEDAWDIMELTTEFGLVVADASPLDEWEVPLQEARLKALKLGPEFSSLQFYAKDERLTRLACQEEDD